MTIQHDDTTPCLHHSRLLKRGVIGWRNSLMLRPVPTDSNTSFSPVRLRYISVRVPSRSETGDTVNAAQLSDQPCSTTTDSGKSFRRPVREDRQGDRSAAV